MKTRYLCTSCNYQFSRKDMPKVCPFCGEPSVVEQVTISADQLLREL